MRSSTSQPLSKSANALRKVIRSNKDERIDLLNLLGLLGILETEEDKGFFNSFVPADVREERNRDGSHDWLYPVSRWTPEAGINDEALTHWFGDYATR